jgi:hypothetical protein
MGRAVGGRLSAFARALPLVLGLAGVAAAVDGGPPPPSHLQARSLVDDEDPTAEHVVSFLSSGDVDLAVAVTISATPATGAADADRLRRLEIAGAVARAVRFARRRDDDRDAVAWALDRASALARADDLALVHALAQSAPEAPPYARAIERAALRSIGQTEDDRRLIILGDDPDPEVRRRAIEAIARRVAALRKKVDEGGTLTRDEQARLADRSVIETLVARLADRTRGADPLSPDLAAPIGATALHALALIETPALVALESAERAGSADAAAALKAVRAAIGARLRTSPGSTWVSGVGEPPAVGVASLPCPGCGKPVSPLARACPACGKPVSPSGALCARCGVPFREGGFCPVCGGGPLPAAQVRPCLACGEENPPEAKFCKKCGASLEAAPKKAAPR